MTVSRLPSATPLFHAALRLAGRRCLVVGGGPVGARKAAALIVTATGIPEVDRAVYLDAERAGVLANAADDPASCSFLMPAVLRRGPCRSRCPHRGQAPSSPAG